MIVKKQGVIILFLMFLFLGVVSAESCDIRLRTDCQTTPMNNILMGVSDLTNAHGELLTNYDYVLCCDFGIGDTTCSGGTNEIIRLSDLTNAHAQAPDYSGPNPDYANGVCYDSLVCQSTNGACAYGEMGILSLSSDTNAHIGGFDDYTTNNICCTGMCGVGEEYNPISGNCEAEQVAYWANPSNTEFIIDNIYVNPGYTKVSLVLRNSPLPPGTDVNFEIYEKDDTLLPIPDIIDDDIRVGVNAIIGTIDADGNAIVEWIPNMNDVNNALAGVEENDISDDFEFYFNVDTSSSGFLNIIITICNGFDYCMDYTTEGECGSDSCMTAEKSVEVDNPLITCGEGYDCYCQWNSESECGPAYSATIDSCGDGVVNIGETCDGSNWAPITACSDFGFAGVDLSCRSDCHFDTLLCTGSAGTCGDGVVNIGETCDGSNWGSGSITGCSNFDDFTGGILTCRSDCLFDTSSCIGGIPGNIKAGDCFFNENTNDNCDDGYLTYSWTTDWNWNDIENPGHLSNEDKKCFAGADANTLACPAQIQLPFISWETLLVTLIIFGVIYTIWNMKKKKTSKKKTPRKKR